MVKKVGRFDNELYGWPFRVRTQKESLAHSEIDAVEVLAHSNFAARETGGRWYSNHRSRLDR